MVFGVQHMHEISHFARSLFLPLRRSFASYTHIQAHAHYTHAHRTFMFSCQITQSCCVVPPLLPHVRRSKTCRPRGITAHTPKPDLLPNDRHKNIHSVPFIASAILHKQKVVPLLIRNHDAQGLPPLFCKRHIAYT